MWSQTLCLLPILMIFILLTPIKKKIPKQKPTLTKQQKKNKQTPTKKKTNKFLWEKKTPHPPPGGGNPNPTTPTHTTPPNPGVGPPQGGASVWVDRKVVVKAICGRPTQSENTDGPHHPLQHHTNAHPQAHHPNTPTNRAEIEPTHGLSTRDEHGL